MYGRMLKKVFQQGRREFWPQGVLVSTLSGLNDRERAGTFFSILELLTQVPADAIPFQKARDHREGVRIDHHPDHDQKNSTYS